MIKQHKFICSIKNSVTDEKKTEEYYQVAIVIKIRMKEDNEI